MAEHSPTPWRVIKAYDDEPARIIDADDDEVAVELIDADASLIVEAVNERDRLRAERTAAITYAVENDLYAVEAQREANQRADRLADIVRRMVPSLRLEIATCGGPKQAPALVKLLGEAREALGEVAP